MTLSTEISLQDIQAAHARICDHVVRTPCLLNERLSQELGCEVFFKAENLQHVSAFKARGALNAVLQLSESDASKGVVTHSSGNHAAALARAAKLRGIPAHVVMPHNSARVKIEAVRALGVDPIFCESDTPSREAVAAKIQSETGATLIHPFNHPDVVAGQGTVALEIIEQVDDVDCVIAPVGGGGLMSGIVIAVRSTTANVDVFGAEPQWADDAFRSMAAGRIELPTRYDTVADGLRSSLGPLTFPILQAGLTDLLLVSESAILEGMRRVTEVAKLVIEPSAAVPFAALVEHADQFRGKRVVIVLTGGNLDFGGCRMGRPE